MRAFLERNRRKTNNQKMKYFKQINSYFYEILVIFYERYYFKCYIVKPNATNFC